MFSYIKYDFKRYYTLTHGHKIKRYINCFRQPGLHAILIFRFGNWIYKNNIFIKLIFSPIYLLFNFIINSLWGISIEKGAIIGKGFRIGHYGGIFINNASVIGDNVHISQDVSIGVSGQGSKRGCPIIGNNVYIAPGAKLFGKIKIGNNVKIGANAIIYKDIPDNCYVVCDCLKIIERKIDFS
ncbi:serine O-acetyltransferase [Hydrogenimonas urashimensis]|uniref:serine O-acetyltransferase n=1 Tax=Hydrogenimonas urashimensis TaxID=2740515 RepID=UPI0019169100|nr:hypothetical protein [Hydrogenimonas urashimensis]